MEKSKRKLISLLILTTITLPPIQLQAQSLLFYEKNSGSAEIYGILPDGDLGKPTRRINNGWRKTWTDVEYYRSDGKNMMLFYESTTGSAEMYEIGPNGDLGKLVKRINNGWRKTWTDVEYFQANGKDMMLFYEGSTGSAAMYELKPDGGLGKQVKWINNGWRKTWTDMEYFQANGKDMMLFYEGQTGSAAIYELKSDGGLGKQVKWINKGWRKTWTNIIFVDIDNKSIERKPLEFDENDNIILNVTVTGVRGTLHDEDCQRLDGAFRIKMYNENKGCQVEIKSEINSTFKLFSGWFDNRMDLSKRNIARLNSSNANQSPDNIEKGIGQDWFTQFKVNKEILSTSLRLDIVGWFHGCHKSGDFADDYNCNLIYRGGKDIYLKVKDLEKGEINSEIDFFTTDVRSHQLKFYIEIYPSGIIQ